MTTYCFIVSFPQSKICGSPARASHVEQIRCSALHPLRPSSLEPHDPEAARELRFELHPDQGDEECSNRFLEPRELHLDFLVHSFFPCKPDLAGCTQFPEQRRLLAAAL
jgi:hypothetical protein